MTNRPSGSRNAAPLSWPVSGPRAVSAAARTGFASWTTRAFVFPGGGAISAARRGGMF